MIKSKSDLEFFLQQDEIARFGCNVGFAKKWRMGLLWKYNVVLRKLEYTINCKSGALGKLLRYWYTWRLESMGLRLGWCIPPNCFGPGLCIVHYGTVIVNNHASVGANCRIQAGVNIGANGGDDAPHLGDNVYIGPGAKLFGNITLGSNIAIGANAVVNKSFDEDSITLVGVPAKIVSHEGSKRFIRVNH